MIQGPITKEKSKAVMAAAADRNEIYLKTFKAEKYSWNGNKR
jgi:hypothetical protein